MFACCMMLTGMSFVTEYLNPVQAWTMQQTYRWVTTASGLSILLRAQQTWNRSKSFWLPFLIEARSSQQDNEADLQNLPSLLLEVCNYDRSRAHLNSYTVGLQVLRSMVRVEPGMRSFARLVSFPSRLSRSFVKSNIRKRFTCSGHTQLLVCANVWDTVLVVLS